MNGKHPTLSPEESTRQQWQAVIDAEEAGSRWEPNAQLPQYLPPIEAIAAAKPDLQLEIDW